MQALLKHWEMRICSNRLATRSRLLFLLFYYSDVPPFPPWLSASVPDAEDQSSGVRGSAQPKSGWRASLPTSRTAGDSAAPRFLQQLHLWAATCLPQHKVDYWWEPFSAFALSNQIILRPQVLQLPLPGHAGWWTVSGIHTLVTYRPKVVLQVQQDFNVAKTRMSNFSTTQWWYGDVEASSSSEPIKNKQTNKRLIPYFYIKWNHILNPLTNVFIQIVYFVHIFSTVFFFLKNFFSVKAKHL